MVTVPTPIRQLCSRNQYIASLWIYLLPDAEEQLDQLADIAADYYHNSFAGVQGKVLHLNV